MPTYDYICKECLSKKEVRHKMNETLNVICPECKNKWMVRCISAGSAVHFKGSGFYATDYKGK